MNTISEQLAHLAGARCIVIEPNYSYLHIRGTLIADVYEDNTYLIGSLSGSRFIRIDDVEYIQDNHIYLKERTRK